MNACPICHTSHETTACPTYFEKIQRTGSPTTESEVRKGFEAVILALEMKMRDAERELILRERARCAEIARRHGKRDDSGYDSHRVCGEAIAREIEKGETT